MDELDVAGGCHPRVLGELRAQVPQADADAVVGPRGGGVTLGLG